MEFTPIPPPKPPAQPDLASSPLPAEIRSQITLDLDAHDLFSLSQVSKDWYHTCIPLLWTHIRILTRTQCDRFLTPEAAQALRYYGCHTRSLQTRYPQTLRPFIEIDEHHSKGEDHDTNGNQRIQLERFDLLLLLLQDTSTTTIQPSNNEADPVGRCVILTDHSHLDLLYRFLESATCTTTLQTLHIHRIPNNPVRLLETIASNLPELRVLTLFAGGGVPYRRIPCLGPEVARGFLENCPSKLRELTFGCKAKGGQPPELCTIALPQQQHDEVTGQGRTVSHSGLRILSLPGAMNGYGEQVLAAGEGGFLQGCTGLEVIESPNDVVLENYWITQSIPIRTVLSEEMETPATGSGSGSGSGLSASGTTTTVVSAKKDTWHTIVVRWAGHHVAEAIVSTSQDHGLLTALELIDPRGVTSQHIQQILVHSRVLRCFQVRHSDTGPSSRPRPGPGAQRQQSSKEDTFTARTRLLATDIISSSWGCLFLTTLHLEIGGIPREDQQRTEESHRIQRQVHQQLGALTRLQELRLGHACELQAIEEYECQQQQQQHHHQDNTRQDKDTNDKVPGFQRDCLEMTLASGLDLLSGLTELSALDLSRMDHRVGPKEFQWMRRHWPKLRTLLGVTILA
ncbi:hypothetical protein BGX29_006593 [Mortierella sp. GBA35]|nr:hypothetical protein BGX29_006593 [Mortierella sp. GBA35]